MCVCFFSPAAVIIISVAEAIILLTVIFLRNRILIAIALIQESSKWVKTLFCKTFFKFNDTGYLLENQDVCRVRELTVFIYVCVCVYSTEQSVTWCPLFCTLWSPLFFCWCVLLIGAPLPCILLLCGHPYVENMLPVHSFTKVTPDLFKCSCKKENHFLTRF